MGDQVKLAAEDGFVLGAYRADPAVPPRGGLVILHEFFGANAHIRSVADGFAEKGFIAVAPALFDRVRRDVELDYGPAGIAEGRALNGQTRRSDTMLDVAAAVDALGTAGRVGVVGYCWGGTLAYAAACDTPGVAAAVGYYGGGIAAMLDERPVVLVMLHFGERDEHIPMRDVDRIRAADPSRPVFTYPAGHGFNCDARGSYDRASAAQALSRTLEFLAQFVG